MQETDKESLKNAYELFESGDIKIAHPGGNTFGSVNFS